LIASFFIKGVRAPQIRRAETKTSRY
jgi:hypothetical protein